MALTLPPVSLTYDLHFVVQWAAGVDDFTTRWEQRLAQAVSGQYHDHLLEAAITVLNDVEQRQDKTEAVLADVYRVSGLLPATGEEVLVGTLVMRVDQRRFTTRYVAGRPHVTVVFRMGIEKYQYEAAPLPLTCGTHIMPTTTAGPSIARPLVIRTIPAFEVVEAVYRRYGILLGDDDSEAAPLAKQEISALIKGAEQEIERFFRDTNNLAAVGDSVVVDILPGPVSYNFKLVDRDFQWLLNGAVAIYYTFGSYPSSDAW